MARPSTSICCSPPESVPAFCAARSRSRGNMREDLLDQGAHLGRVAAVLEAAELEVLAHGEERKHVPALGHERDAEVGPRPRAGGA